MQRAAVAVVCTAVSVAAATVPGSGVASAADATDSTTANVVVGGVITLTALSNSFTLSGNPGQTVTTATPVTMTVTTNNATGYSVTVEPASPDLTGALPGNTDTIPTTLLQVRETGGGAFTALDPTTPTQVFTSNTPSAADGDTISNDYQITIPFVQPDTYSGTLNYIASTI